MTYTVSTTTAVALAVLVVWDLFWRGLALWHAAREQRRAWFITLLIINSASVLPIIYLLMHRKTDHYAMPHLKGVAP